MKTLVAVTSLGILAAVGLGTWSSAADELGFDSGSVAEETSAPTSPVEDEAGELGDSEAQTDSEGGLSCVLVPIEEDAGTDADEPTTPTIAEMLATNTIVCTGTGSERSASVALLPRFLAHSDLWSGREKGAAISEWAKVHANKPTESNETSAEGDIEPSETEVGHGGPGNGQGHAGGHGNGNGKGNGGRD